MKSNIPHKKRKSFSKWNTKVNRTKSDTTLEHLQSTASQSGTMANHNNGSFGKAKDRFFSV